MSLTLIFGGSLVALGVAAYLATARKSKTALIPAVFGVVVCGLGAAAIVSPAFSSTAVIAATALAAVGLVGTGRAVMLWLKGPAAAGAATASKAFMALLCLLFLGASLLLRG